MDAPTILNASAVGPYQLRVVWMDGPTNLIDMEHVISTRQELRPLRNLAKFKDLELVRDGLAIEWFGVRLNSDELWKIAERS